MRYAAYVRVSREEQVLGYSLEAQERLVRDWVGQQRGDLSGDLVVVYRDEGHSARTDDRPAFQQMVADARSGQFEAIVVHKFDRLARDRYDAVAYKTLWRSKLGIKVLSASEPSQDSDGALGMLVEGILEVVAPTGTRSTWPPRRARASAKRQKRASGTARRRPATAPGGVKPAPSPTAPATAPMPASPTGEMARPSSPIRSRRKRSGWPSSGTAAANGATGTSPTCSTRPALRPRMGR